MINKAISQRLISHINLNPMVLNVVKEAHTQYLHYIKYSYSIVEAYYRKKARVRGKVAYAIIYHRLEFQEWQDGYLILHLSSGLRTDKEARDIFKSALGTQCLRCIAVVATGKAKVRLLEFLAEVQQQCIPIRVFGNREDAMSWVLEQRFAIPFSLN